MNQRSLISPPTIYVYHDKGVGKECLKQTLNTLRNISTNRIQTVNADDVCQGTWMYNAVLFILPGGADVPYVQKLRGQGDDMIKKYVQNGGSFLGICAGSYYASSRVIFDPKGPLEVIGKRDLSFFKGHAVGPIFGPYDYKTMQGCRSAKITTIFPDIPETAVFYNGGGFFRDAKKFNHTKVIATYDNQLPAIIATNHGKGRIVLSAVHFEYDPFTLDEINPHIAKIIQPLRHANPSRKRLISRIMHFLRVTPS